MKTTGLSMFWGTLWAVGLIAGAARAEYPRRDAVVEAVEKARDSVVSIKTETLEAARASLRRNYLFFGVPDMGRLMFPDIVRYFRVPALASGVILDEQGYALTNEHVISGAVSLRIGMADGQQYDAELIGKDPESDLAVIRILAPPETRFKPLNIGRSDDLMIGESVIVIGNNHGYEHTVTVGVISGTERYLQVEGNKEYFGLIQTDAAINRGNSGGALLNINGELIGITTLTSGGAENIGFAIPAARIRQTYRECVHGLLSFESRLGILPTSPVLSKADVLVVLEGHGLGVSSQGAPIPDRILLVSQVEDGSLGAQAGITRGALLSSVNGQPIRSISQWRRVLEEHTGPELRLGVLRDTGRDEDGAVLFEKLEVSVDTSQLADAVPDHNDFWFGFRVRGLSSDRAAQLRIPVDWGVEVLEVQPSSPADEVRLVVGDVIRFMAATPGPAGVQSAPISSLSDFRALQRRLAHTDTLELVAYREGTDYQVRLKRKAL